MKSSRIILLSLAANCLASQLDAAGADIFGETPVAPARPPDLALRRLQLDEFSVVERQQRYSDGVKACSRALESNPNDPLILARLGQFQYCLSQFGEAEATLQRALKADPDQALARATLALVFVQTARGEAAVRLLQEAIRLQPDRDDFHFNLALTLATSKPPNLPAARTAYARSLQLGGAKDPGVEALLKP